MLRYLMMGLLLAAAGLAVGQEVAEPVRLRFSFIGGTEMIGRVTLKEIGVKTTYAALKIQAKGLERMDVTGQRMAPIHAITLGKELLTVQYDTDRTAVYDTKAKKWQ